MACELNPKLWPAQAGMSADDTCDTFSANILIRAGARARVFNPNACHMCHRHANGAASMSRRAAKVTQADVARVLRAAQSAGPTWRVEVTPDGIIRLVQGEFSPQSTARSASVPVAHEKDWRL
jgi:hypothetical protein